MWVYVYMCLYFFWSSYFSWLIRRNSSTVSSFFSLRFEAWLFNSSTVTYGSSLLKFVFLTSEYNFCCCFFFSEYGVFCFCWRKLGVSLNWKIYFDTVKLCMNDIILHFNEIFGVLVKKCSFLNISYFRLTCATLHIIIQLNTCTTKFFVKKNILSY